MKRIKLITVIFFTVICMMMILTPTASAHELYIEVDEVSAGEELRVDVLWGHIRDYVSEADHDDYQLYALYPNGETEQLDLEAVGVHARAYVPANDEGNYTFWAVKEASTYTPEDGETQLSNQMAKVIHQVGDDTSAAGESIEMDLQMVPDSDTAISTTGQFSGTVLMDDNGESDADVTAYGPEGEILEETSDNNGAFNFTFESEGKWLLKTDVTNDEPGELSGEAYEEVNHTSTLLLNIDQPEEDNRTAGMWSLAAMLLAGLLIGLSIPLFLSRLNRQ